MKKRDAILLPGLKLNPDGSPKAELILRIQKAYELHKKGLAPVIIACGGDAAGVGVSEAEVIRAHLTFLGVPKECVIIEDKSLITAENFINAARIPGTGKNVLLVTSDYHMLRALVLCRRAGFRPKGCSVKTGGKKSKKRVLELLGILDALCGWQDEGKTRPKPVSRFKDWAIKHLSD